MKKENDNYKNGAHEETSGDEVTEKKKIRRYLTPKELQEEVVDWSIDTLKRRIELDGFPAIKDASGILIPAVEMELWFKKRPKVS